MYRWKKNTSEVCLEIYFNLIFCVWLRDIKKLSYYKAVVDNTAYTYVTHSTCGAIWVWSNFFLFFSQRSIAWYSAHECVCACECVCVCVCLRNIWCMVGGDSFMCLCPDGVTASPRNSYPNHPMPHAHIHTQSNENTYAELHSRATLK